MADYVTVVEVDDPSSKDNNHLHRNSTRHSTTALTTDDPSFITVLSINNNNINNQQLLGTSVADNNQSQAAETEAVVVYRLVGERLGFGLKFQGGTRSAEKVQKLFIQSCATDSPASKVITSWGQLREGDEILQIDEFLVKDMTRIECVKCLKDNVAIKLVVRNGRGLKPEDLEEDAENSATNGLHMSGGSSNGQVKAAPPPPPPVPPRKLVKRQRSFKDNDLKDMALNKADPLDMANSERSFTPPPDAEYYINLFAENNSSNVVLRNPSRNGESESDDTASTISTVIDRYSMTSNYSSESDLSGFASLNNGPPVVMNKPELAKVLKPFALLEQEFQVNAALESSFKSVLDTEVLEMELKPGNNYENIEFKTEKINVYENVQLKGKENNYQEKEDKKEENETMANGSSNNEEKEENAKQTTPTPKPRQVTLSPVEPKKRSIIPMPRKLSINGKQAIEVPPPKIPDSAFNKHNQATTASNTPQNTPTNENTQPKEFTTKIPKAIQSPSSQYRSLERAKTESEIKLKQESKIDKLKLQTSEFLANESSTSLQKDAKQNKTPSPPSKSRIPIVLTPKRSFDLESALEKKILHKSPTSIPRLLTKQKSETDLKLAYCNTRFKESSPVGSSKIPLQRTISAESKVKMPEQKTLIPILHQSLSANTNSSTESLNSSNSSPSTKGNRGPKPKPPERVQSLNKTQIPKLSGNNNVTTVTVVDRNSVSPQNSAGPSMQTFKKQASPPKLNDKPLTPPSPNREIRFKIQTYASNSSNNSFQEPEEMPSLFDLQRRNSPDTSRKNVEDLSTFKSVAKAKQELEDELDRITPPPMVVGKCVKVDETAPTYYSSSSSDEENEADGGGAFGDDEKEYICEDGEKLGPPELINGPGPSEAYFNLYWHSNMLPTIGEVEEECSSMEMQSLTTNGPIVIVDDLSQQKSSSSLAEVVKTEQKATEDETKTPANNTSLVKLKKPAFIGVPVLPPTVPTEQLENLKKNLKEAKAIDKKMSESKEDVKIMTISGEGETNEKSENSEEKLKAGDKIKPDEVTKAIEEIDGLKLQKSEADTGTPLLQSKEAKPTAEIHSAFESTKEEQKQEHSEVVKTSSTAISQDSSHACHSSQEMTTETQHSTMKTETKTTTTMKKVIKSSSTTTSQVVETNVSDLSLEAMPEELTQLINSSSKATESSIPEEFKKMLTASKSPLENKTISFTLQPYAERKGNTKITVLEERQFESDQKAYSEIRTKDSKTGEEKVQKSSETHKERAKLKKVQSHDSLDDQEASAKPLTVTAQAETRLSEEAHNPQDKQSIVRGILNLSECGKQMQPNNMGGVDMVECEHQVLETFEDSEHTLSADKKENKLNTEEQPSLIREICETLTVSKDGDTQVTKHSEITKEVPNEEIFRAAKEEQLFKSESQEKLSDIDHQKQKAKSLLEDQTQQLIEDVLKDAEKQVLKQTEKQRPVSKKGPKLVKKTEEEKKLEMEAQKLIDSYQKVRKEAEKLFQYDSFKDEDDGFDLSGLEEKDEKPIKTESIQPEQIIEIKENIEIESKPEDAEKSDSDILSSPVVISPSSSEDFLKEEPSYVLHKNILEENKVEENLDRKETQEESQIAEIVNHIDKEVTSPKETVPLSPGGTKEIIEIEEITTEEIVLKSVKISPKAHTKLSPKTSPKLSPKLKKSEKKSKHETDTTQEESTSSKLKPKPAPKPKPPVPQRRGSADIVKPIPKRRGSLETSTTVISPKELKEEIKTTTPIIEMPTPMERIIVGVEHHIVIPTAVLKSDPTPTTSPVATVPSQMVITLASENLPSVVENQSPIQSNFPLLTQTASGDLLETIHLPNVSSASDVTQAARDILTSSSMDSIQSVTETIEDHEVTTMPTTDEEESLKSLEQDTLEMKVAEERDKNKIEGKQRIREKIVMLLELFQITRQFGSHLFWIMV
ncbi:uncharacterized protein LOC106090085 isoform X1 [Stomoxys calcitrans]|uniref:uncharacterized protein LOC106090085 isoform X1 n=1 Tax=Stomoxys calcitrans TaxID=35570 RepID=UPI0027E31F1E|nr:uncharacterized protein LOC106090085 isoform X1 [Stomoxys calcitrans]